MKPLPQLPVVTSAAKEKLKAQDRLKREEERVKQENLKREEERENPQTLQKEGEEKLQDLPNAEEDKTQDQQKEETLKKIAPNYAKGIGNEKTQTKRQPPPPEPTETQRAPIKAPPENGNMDTPETTFQPFDNELYPKGNTDKQRRKECPMTVMTDSYKATHFLMYPEAQEMRAYGEFRKPYPGMNDDRIVVYGIRYYIDNFIKHAIPDNDINSSRSFLKGHLVSKMIQEGDYFKKHDTEVRNPKGTADLNYLDLLEKIKKFPVKIEAMPEGSVIRPHIPAFIITAKGEHSRFCTFLETILTMIWYPSCVATLSRHTRDRIERAFDISVDDDAMNLLDSRLHDFGFRGCTSVEQSVIGGCAHLLNFSGSDTMSACYYAQYVLNAGKPVGYAIPATEHSVMTSWPDEVQAVKNLCRQFPGGLVSSVMDAYDYDRMLDTGLPLLKPIVEQYECTLIVRPDSGDAVEQVIKALDAAFKARYRHRVNKKGFIVFDNFAVLQGDGIDYEIVRKILNAVLDKQYAASNVAFGMGGGLLQKVNRDTMSFATKLCYMRDMNGQDIDVVKDPKGQKDKLSLGGKMVVLHKTQSGQIAGEHFVCTEKAAEKYLATNNFARSMKVVYDGTEPTTAADSAAEIDQLNNETFDDVKMRLTTQWKLFSPQRPALDTSMVISQHETRKNAQKRQEVGFAQAKALHGTERPDIHFSELGLVSKAEFHPEKHNQTIQLNSSLKESSQAILHALEKML